jgi:DNA repair protein RadC
VSEMYFIKDIPSNQRPREKLLQYGVEYLSDEELLAIILRTGNSRLSVLEVAKQFLYSLSSLKELSELTYLELYSQPGFGEVKAMVLLAAVELGKRVAMSGPINRMISSPQDVFSLLSPQLSPLKQEHFVALYLDIRSRLIAQHTLFIGGLSQSIVHPREVFKYAVKYSAHQVILVHNHPSGDCRPSEHDIAVTNAFVDAGELLQIKVVDHLIIGGNDIFSIMNQLKR